MTTKLILTLSLFAFSTVLSQAQDLLLFGGRDNKTFLGSLTSKYDQDSILNKYGDYGSKYSTNSIWNEYGDFGSKYSDYCPWNSYANNPPIIVDEEGNFYGYFTVNKYKTNRTRVKWILEFLDGS